MRTAPAALIAACLALVASACSDDAADQADPPAESTSASTSTTEPPAPICDEVALPAGAQDLSEADGDVDGDGEPDELFTYRTAGDEWRVHVALGAGGGGDAPLGAFGEVVGVIGGADVDGDGADEIWARTGSGASATIVGLLRFEGCRLERVTFATGAPVELPVGGSIGTSVGVECEAADPEGDLTAYTATRLGEQDYAVVATEYALVEGELVELGSEESAASTADDDFPRYTSFECGDLSSS